MKTFEVQITQLVTVTVDETKFDDDFLREFDQNFYNFNGNISSHAEHLAWLYATGREEGLTTFIEGYGNVDEMGIEVHVKDYDTDVLQAHEVIGETM